ncbi:MAG: hypothetical protein HPY90_05105 [Syntrophothermus sp.]|uniref:putative zinc-binding protein n=1 Tax=Syntrophothermus sp. TaxID=2736299 RepID=UPI00257DDFFF|nr:putative zinc-binding protein [Syntrophothermus sp.]NSW82646.1 hypothetical protein [Syntrophothermus sp.]
MTKKIMVLPCSGIGKAYGEISRQAAYELIDDIRPEDVTTACLGRFMIRDSEVVEQAKNSFIITVDGCAKECALKNVEAAGLKVDKAVRTIEVFKEHRDLKPEGVLQLGEPGFKLAHILAQKLAGEVDCLMKEEG